MKNTLYDHGYGTAWNDVCVERREGYRTSVADFHEHDFYEINLILSGNVKILLTDRVEEGTGSRIVLTRPGTPHFVSCSSDVLYSRLYLAFSESFAANYVPEWNMLCEIFGKNGNTFAISDHQKQLYVTIIEQIEKEHEQFRRKLLILYLLSIISESAETVKRGTAVPPHIIDALTYIDAHFSEKLTAKELAEKLHVGRTTLMTTFRKYTGNTLCGYIVHLRLKNAVNELYNGKSEKEAAASCGFGDTGNLIRHFKKIYGMTPKRYIAKTSGTS